MLAEASKAAERHNEQALAARAIARLRERVLRQNSVWQTRCARAAMDSLPLPLVSTNFWRETSGGFYGLTPTVVSDGQPNMRAGRFHLFHLHVEDAGFDLASAFDLDEDAISVGFREAVRKAHFRSQGPRAHGHSHLASEQLFCA